MKTGFENKTTDDLAQMAIGHAATQGHTDAHFNELARIVSELLLRLKVVEDAST